MKRRVLKPGEPDRSEVVYKSVGEAALKLHVFRPRKPADASAAIVFFFGGGWKSGSPGQFDPHCKHVASKGMVGITVEYRYASPDVGDVRSVVEEGLAIPEVVEIRDRVGTYLEIQGGGHTVPSIEFVAVG